MHNDSSEILETKNKTTEQNSDSHRVRRMNGVKIEI